MPTITAFYQNESSLPALQSLVADLRQYASELLTCGEIQLQPHEISVRLTPTTGGTMIGDVELEITAHAFKERVRKQDQICLDIKKFLEEKAESLGEIRVWLVLAELGYSWK